MTKHSPAARESHDQSFEGIFIARAPSKMLKQVFLTGINASSRIRLLKSSKGLALGLVDTCCICCKNSSGVSRRTWIWDIFGSARKKPEISRQTPKLKKHAQCLKYPCKNHGYSRHFPAYSRHFPIFQALCMLFRVAN